MGILNLNDFREELKSAIGNRDVDNSRLDRWINFAYLDLAGAIDFEVFDDDTQDTTTNGSGEINAPSDVMMVKVVRDNTNDLSLGWIPKEEYHRRSRSSSGEPTNWTRHKDKLLLHPIPDGAYTINIIYKTLPSQLSSLSDTTDLPGTWDSAVHQLSTYHALLALGEEQRASVWYARVVNFIQTRMTEDLLQATSNGIGLSLPPIRQLDIRPFVGQMERG